VLQLPTHLRMQMKAVFPLPLHKKSCISNERGSGQKSQIARQNKIK